MTDQLIEAQQQRSPETIAQLASIASRFNTSFAQKTDIGEAVAMTLADRNFAAALIAVTHAELDERAERELIERELIERDCVHVLGDLRRLRSALTMTTGTVIGLLASVFGLLRPDSPAGAELDGLSQRLVGTDIGSQRLGDAIGTTEWADALTMADPHSTAATSPYRRSSGVIAASADCRVVEAAVTLRTFTSLRVVENVLDPGQRLLADLYAPLRRCVAFVDQNVYEHHSQRLIDYFDFHNTTLEIVVHRAMEVDKGIRTVERMLGELKAHGVARNEPVLIMGGGVLADTAGLACALYHRSTPYVMLSTSLVTGIDAGPSPRTCCDGFGYKNLLGAYHPPVMSITDPTFFSTLRAGWLRHGLAEIAKMAIVDDIELFSLLESVGPDLVATRFGNVDAPGLPDLGDAPSEVISAALRSYVGAEYGNLYETHQLRPHAYGHTWSPGFEIAAGLLHGHAVSIGMGFGAFLSNRYGLLSDSDLQRVLDLLSSLELSTWHDVLDDHDLVWLAQERAVEKRGGKLFAPVPKDRIGAVGYLDAPTRIELGEALFAYRELATAGVRGGIGIEPLCSDVGLEDPSIIALDEPDFAVPAML